MNPYLLPTLLAIAVVAAAWLAVRVKRASAELEAVRAKNAERESVLKAERDLLRIEFEAERSLLHSLLDNIPDQIYFKDTQSRFLRVNQAVANTLGAPTPEAALGKTDVDYFPAEIAKNFRDDDQRVLAGEVLQDRIESGARGERHWWMSTTKVPVLDRDGKVIGLVGISRDISDRKRVEMALARERDLLNILMESTPDHIYIKDAGGRFLRVNSAMGRINGSTSAESMLGVRDSDVMTPEDAALYRADDEAILATGQPIMNKRMQLEVNGERRWFSVTKAPVIEKDGKVIGIVGVNRDIMEQEKAERALADERNLMRTMIDNLPDLIYCKDTQGRFILCNVPILRLFGKKTMEEVLGKTDHDTSPPHLAEHYIANDKELFRTRQPVVDRQEPSIAADGSERWLSTTKVPLFSASGELLGLVGISRDITEQRRIEKQLTDANEQLNRLAREDALTGLRNRRMILELAEAEWCRWHRYGKAFCVLVIDADNFKSVNDRHGHQAGDQALKYIASRLRESVRASDVVGRYGGEEFIIILPETDLPRGIFASEKVLTNVSKSPVHFNGTALSLTVSIGVASVRPEDRNVDMLIHRADIALLHAKQQGKNRVVSS